MTLERLAEIIREQGGEVLLTQKAFETVYREMQEGCLVVPEADETANHFKPLTFQDLPIHWSRRSFTELMDFQHELLRIAAKAS